jgi:hypothetical protein
MMDEMPGTTFYHQSVRSYLTEAIRSATDVFEVSIITVADAYNGFDKHSAVEHSRILIMDGAHYRICSVEFEIEGDLFSYVVKDQTGSEQGSGPRRLMGSPKSMSPLLDDVRKCVRLAQKAAEAREDIKAGGGSLGEEPTVPPVQAPFDAEAIQRLRTQRAAQPPNQAAS